ncbi:MAG: nucleoside triphosphate pyrophosphohydrolase [Chloroherpetonaceae bacterium]|nr:nucleoside triphosphate pyrophosphohydrolase [Chthonomonadaceae bacterium]MDW8206579.1 nucleoside triphosphate pyrophosphohydrolase [Chloroherpetonaceae bacterium]
MRCPLPERQLPRPVIVLPPLLRPHRALANTSVITLIGLGPGDADTLSRGAERALRDASRHHQQGTGRLFLRTVQHPVVEWMRAEGMAFESFDTLYDTAPDFDTLYSRIAHRVLDAACSPATAPGLQEYSVAYAVPGHPLFGEESVRRICIAAEQAGVPTRVVASGSFVEAVLTAANASLEVGCDVRDALTLQAFDTVSQSGERIGGRVDVTRGLLIFQVYDRAVASQVKLALMRDYPDEWEIVLIQHAGVPGRESVWRVPLFQLDRHPVDHLTSVYVPPLPPSLRRPVFETLVGVMARLRSDTGCPWDREQDHRTLRRYLIEETYEAIEAIEAEDPDRLCEELGDVLLQVVFHAQLARESGLFTIDDVTSGIVTKLVRRHPHVFGDTRVANSAEVLQNWERIKRAEQGAQIRASVLDGVPKGLPALMRAMEISKRVAKVGFEWAQFADVMAKVEEELGELKAELGRNVPDRDRVAAELGDLLFTLVQIARWQHIDPEEALRDMLTRFTTRFLHMEDRARAMGRNLTELSPEEMDTLWNEAKAR